MTHMYMLRCIRYFGGICFMGTRRYSDIAFKIKMVNLWVSQQTTSDVPISKASFASQHKLPRTTFCEWVKDYEKLKQIPNKKKKTCHPGKKTSRQDMEFTVIKYVEGKSVDGIGTGFKDVH